MVIRNHIERRRVGRGFEYYNQDGQIRDKATLKYIKSLAIPPAWRDVKINLAKSANLVAMGIDKAGRQQYIYSATYRKHQEKKKFERILRFANALPKMREITNAHLAEPGLKKDKVLACIVRLMDEAYFRIGNEEYAKQNQSFGLSTLRSRHITIQGDSVTFDFIGKSGQPQHKKVTDRAVAKLIKRLDELPGYHVFKYYDENRKLTTVKSKDVNKYIRDIMGEEFSAKDFRTWGGTLLASAELAEIERAHSERERKKAVTACVRRVARRLGNTPAIARSSYIDPRVITTFLNSDDLRIIRAKVRHVKHRSYLNHNERCVLKLLEQNS